MQWSRIQNPVTVLKFILIFEILINTASIKRLKNLLWFLSVSLSLSLSLSLSIYLSIYLPHTFNIRHNTFGVGGCRQWCFAWFLTGVSALPTSYSPHQADPIRDDQTLILPPVYARVESISFIIFFQNLQRGAWSLEFFSRGGERDPECLTMKQSIPR